MTEPSWSMEVQGTSGWIWVMPSWRRFFGIEGSAIWITCWVLTNMADHVGGLIWLPRHLSVGQYWGTGVERPIQFVRDLNKALNDKHLEERVAVRGDDIVPAGPCRFTVRNPARDNAAQPSVPSHSGTLLNNRSIATRFQ